MNDRRTTAALLVGHRRARAVVDSPHMLPEFLDIVRCGHAIEPRLDLGRQRLIGGVHVRELGAAERLAVAVRDADAVEHVHKARHLAIGHVGVPVLPSIRAADVAPFSLRFERVSISGYCWVVGRDRAWPGPGSRRTAPKNASARRARGADRENAAPHAVRAPRGWRPCRARPSGCARSMPRAIAPSTAPLGSNVSIAISLLSAAARR